MVMFPIYLDSVLDPNPDPFVFGLQDPDPNLSIMKQKKKRKKNCFYCFVTFYDFLSLKNDVNIPKKVKSKIKFLFWEYIYGIFVAVQYTADVK
jgi:hypothetical protein